MKESVGDSGSFLSRDLREPRLRQPSPPSYTPKYDFFLFFPRFWCQQSQHRPWGSDFNSYGEATADNEDSKPALIDWDGLNNNREENERKRWAHLPDLRKDFYEELEEVKS